MKREIEEANTTHIKWFLPIPVTHYTELIVGEFLFDPYEDSSKAFARHIRVSQMQMLNLFHVTIRKLENRKYLGPIISDYNQEGNLYKVMCEIQNDMTAQAVIFIEELANAEREERGGERSDAVRPISGIKAGAKAKVSGRKSKAP
jgi:hypothetical protein